MTPSSLCISTHQNFCVGLVPDLDHSVPRRAVHPGLCSIKHGEGHRGGQQVDPLQHGPFGPAQRLCHGPETHLTTWGGMEKLVGRQWACCRHYVVLLKMWWSDTCVDLLPRGLRITVVDVLRHSVIIKQIFEFPFEIRTEFVHQTRTWINDIL